MPKGFTKGLTRLVLAAALLCAAVGANAFAAVTGGARPECPMMSRLHACCKKARQSRDSRAGVPPRLCCVTNFPRPAPAGTNYAAQQSPGAATDPRPPAAPQPVAPAARHARGYAPPFRPSHPPPAYVQHAAFLI
ncbi:MAG TPA: hypothetical protein VF736_24000 [Pyrinomonadaceae bacterium]|jgi:hypothetical protein